jgi:hypothetical protein
MRLYPEELMIMKLRGEVPKLPQLKWLEEMTEDECIEELRKSSGLDFGQDVKAWVAWWAAEKIRQDIDDD